MFSMSFISFGFLFCGRGTLDTNILCYFSLCRTRRNELAIKGTIIFDANSTITVSPVNFQ